MAPQVGLEPTTLRLTAGCSAIELLRNVAGALRKCALNCNDESIVSDGPRRRQRLSPWPARTIPTSPVPVGHIQLRLRAGGKDAILLFQPAAERVRQRATHLLPGQHLATHSHFITADASHHREPLFTEIGTPRICDYTEARIRRKRGKHIAQQLVRPVTAFRSRQ